MLPEYLLFDSYVLYYRDEIKFSENQIRWSYVFLMKWSKDGAISMAKIAEMGGTREIRKFS